MDNVGRIGMQSRSSERTDTGARRARKWKNTWKQPPRGRRYIVHTVGGNRRRFEIAVIANEGCGCPPRRETNTEGGGAAKFKYPSPPVCVINEMHPQADRPSGRVGRMCRSAGPHTRSHSWRPLPPVYRLIFRPVSRYLSPNKRPQRPMRIVVCAVRDPLSRLFENFSPLRECVYIYIYVYIVYTLSPLFFPLLHFLSALPLSLCTLLRLLVIAHSTVCGI